MGRRDPIPQTNEIHPDLLARRRRSLARKIALMTPEMVRDTISEEKAVSLGVGNEWRKKVGP